MLINVKNLFVWLLFVVFGNRRRCYFDAMMPFRLPAREKQEAGSDARATFLLGLKGGVREGRKGTYFLTKNLLIYFSITRLMGSEILSR